MSTWYPSALTYRQWCQAESFLSDIQGSLGKQSAQIRSSIYEQTRIISDQTKAIVATNEQMILALEDSFSHLSQITERGFSQVTSAVEAMHSDLNYNFGILIQRIEYQNDLLTSILHAVESPFEIQVKELYNNACKFLRQENLDAAIDCFKESISQKMGKYFFPSYHQLGRLYITGKVSNQNVIEPKIAMEYLLKANELGNGIIKDDGSFRPILSDCKFFLSLSYYFQMSGKDDTSEKDLLCNAIKYCEEAVSLNPNLSQAFYHLAKYYSYKNDIENLIFYLGKAIEIDRDYTFKWEKEEDKVLEKNRIPILNFLLKLKELKRKSAEPKLLKAKNYIAQLEQKNISQSKFYEEFLDLKRIVQSAENDFKTQTYFGFDDCESKLNSV